LARGSGKFHVYQGNVSPLRGEKPIFGPLSKTIPAGLRVMAALRAGLPVIIRMNKHMAIMRIFRILSRISIFG